MNIFEGMYGTSRSSYLRLEHARMVVRHSTKIDDTKIGARGRCVEAIFVENADGERFRFPTTHVAPARAMTEHVNHGGSFTDPVGGQIIEMAGVYAHLAECSRFVFHHANALSEAAHGVRENCRCHLRELRQTFERLSRPAAYAEAAAALAERARTLTETTDADAAPSAEQIGALREMLAVEGRALPDAVLETVCRTLAVEAADAEPADAEPPAAARKMTSVFGRPVSRAAWRAFADGSLPLTGPPDLDIGSSTAAIRPDRRGKGRGERLDPRSARAAPGEQTGFTRKMARLLLNFGAVVAVVADPEMANLLSYIDDQLSADAVSGDLRREMIAVARHAIKAAGLSLDETFARHSPVCRFYERWTRQFAPRRVLGEAGMYNNNPYDYDDTAMDDAVGAALDQFRVEDFLGTPLMRERLADADTEPGVAPELARAAVLDALVDYLDELANQNIDLSDTLYELPELRAEAEELYPQVEQALRARGVVVVDDAAAGAEVMDEDAELSQEDVLLPTHDQGLSLAREVTAATVKDPLDGHPEIPDTAYVTRLSTLAGLNDLR